MPIPALTKRLVKGSPLTSAEGDANLDTQRDFSNALEARLDVSLNANGSLKYPKVVRVSSSTTTDEPYAVTSSDITISELSDLDGVLILLYPDVSNGTATPGSTAPRLSFNTFVGAIKKFGDQNLDVRDIRATHIAELTYNTANGTFNLLNPATGGRENTGVDTGAAGSALTTTTIVVSTTGQSANFREPQTVNQLYDGYSITVKAANASSRFGDDNGNAGATMKLGGLAAYPVKKLQNGALRHVGTGDIVVGDMVTFIWNETSLVWRYSKPHPHAIEHVITITVEELTQIPAASGVATFTHSVGIAPRKVRVVMVCQNAVDNGWQIGDEVDISQVYMNVGATSTNIVVARASGSMGVMPKTGGAYSLLTVESRWKLKVYAAW